MPTYIALLRKDPDSDYGVDFPDFPGCISAGSTLEEARLMAQDALSGHIECLLELGQSLPQPTSAEAVMADPENADAIPFLVSMRDMHPRAVRVSLSIPEADMRAIDAWAKRHGLTRSAALAEAARRLLAEAG